MLTLNNIGFDICHKGDFSIDRPTGSGDWLIIIFKTQASLTLGTSEMIVPSESAIIFRKGTPQFYKTICGNYVNHFLHFQADSEDELKDIILDQLLFPKDLPGIETLFRMICQENVSNSPNKTTYLSLLTKLVLLKLSEHADACKKNQTSQRTHILSDLRANMYNNPAKFQNIQQLAEEVGFSCSHFQQIYKKEFGISCYEDLLTARIKTAQYYLGETNLNIHEISQLCGYDNDTCFLHLFKARTGITPSEYRKKAIFPYVSDSTPQIH